MLNKYMLVNINSWIWKYTHKYANNSNYMMVNMFIFLKYIRELRFSFEEYEIEWLLYIVAIEWLAELTLVILQVNKIILDLQMLYHLLVSTRKIFWSYRSWLFHIREDLIELFVKDFVNVRTTDCNLIV